jgi:hypothetical protein
MLAPIVKDIIRIAAVELARRAGAKAAAELYERATLGGIKVVL